MWSEKEAMRLGRLGRDWHSSSRPNLWAGCVRRRDFMALLGSAAAWPLAARAQQAASMVGFLSASSAAQAVLIEIAHVWKPPREQVKTKGLGRGSCSPTAATANEKQCRRHKALMRNTAARCFPSKTSSYSKAQLY